MGYDPTKHAPAGQHRHQPPLHARRLQQPRPAPRLGLARMHPKDAEHLNEGAGEAQLTCHNKQLRCDASCQRLGVDHLKQHGHHQGARAAQSTPAKSEQQKARA